MSIKFVDVGGGRRLCWPADLVPNDDGKFIDHAVLVQDVSPSMGHENVVRCVEEWKRAVAKAAGGRPIPATIITFATNAGIRRFRGWEEINPNTFRTEGHCTYMAPTVDHLMAAMRDLTNINTWVTIISDGVVHDCEQFVDRFGRKVGTDMLGVKKWTVTPVRLHHNPGDAPEIRALCHIAQMSATPDGLCTVTKAADFGDVVSGPTPSACIRNTDTGYLLRVVNGRMFETSDKTTFDNVSMVPMDGAEALTHLEAHAEEQLRRLTMAKIAGTRIDEDAETLAQLVEKLRLQTEGTEAASDVRVRDRARTIVANLTKAQRDVVQHLRELKNNDAVRFMNNNQLDGMLRSMDPASKHARSYTRRAATDGTDIAKEISNAIKMLRSHAARFHIKMDADASGRTPDTHRRQCWLSQETSLEAFIAAMDGAIQVVQSGAELDLTSFYKLFGLMGIPVSHSVAEFPDPVMVGGRIKDVVQGVAMLEQSLRNAYDHQLDPSQDGVIKSPYSDTQISAVIPIFDDEWNDPEVWDFFWTLTKFGRFTTSAQLRRAAFPVPNDAPMFVMATILHLIRKYGSDDMPESVINTLRLLRQTLCKHLEHSMAKYARTIDALEAHPIATMAPLRSDAGFSHTMHAFAFFICAGRGFNKKQSIQALVAFCVWRTLRFDPDRDRKDILLRDLLGVTDAEDRLTPLLPDDQPEPDADTITHFDRPVVWSDSPLVRNFERCVRDVYNVVRWAWSADNVPTWEEFCNDILTGPNMDFQRLTQWHIAVAILANGEAQRLNKDDPANVTDAFPYPQTNAEVDAWLSGLVRDYYANNYRVRAAEKAVRVRRNAVAELYTTGVASLSASEFHAKMCALIPNTANSADAQVVTSMVQTLTDMDTPVVDREEKLRLIVLGNTQSGLKWNNGVGNKGYARNPAVKDVFKDDADTLEAMDNMGALWHHIYTRNTFTNRHHRGNFMPSVRAVTGWPFMSLCKRRDPEAYAGFMTHFRSVYARTDVMELPTSESDPFWDDFATNPQKQELAVWHAMHYKGKHTFTDWDEVRVLM